jgi:hypothetical protein
VSEQIEEDENDEKIMLSWDAAELCKRNDLSKDVFSFKIVKMWRDD